MAERQRAAARAGGAAQDALMQLINQVHELHCRRHRRNPERSAAAAGVTRMVKKLKRQEAWAVSAFGVASPPVVRYSFATINGAHRGLDGRGRLMDWARILAYVTGTVDQELLARNEYLAAENRILKSQLNGRLKLSDAERAMLGKIGHRLGRQALAEVATVARPDTILAWYRKLVAGKFDGSKARRGPGRPRVTREVEQLIVRMASENRDWGYDRIVGALANLGYVISDQTVGNILHRHALPPAPERKRTTTWPAFIRTHLALLAGTDFFTAEVLTLRGLVTYYVLFFIHLESRRVDIAGITIHPDEPWMRQIARNVTMEGCGTLRDCRYLLHDRDTKYTQSFRAIIVSGRVEPLALCPLAEVARLIQSTSFIRRTILGQYSSSARFPMNKPR